MEHNYINLRAAADVARKDSSPPRLRLCIDITNEEGEIGLEGIPLSIYVVLGGRIPALRRQDGRKPSSSCASSPRMSVSQASHFSRRILQAYHAGLL